MDWNDGHKKLCNSVVAPTLPPTFTRPAAATTEGVGHQDSTAVHPRELRVLQAMSALTVKLHMQNKANKIPAVGSMLEIEQYVKSKFVTAAPFSLWCVDEDGDVITLTSDAEFQEAARCARAANMALKISVCLTGLREREGGEKSERMTGEKGERKGIRKVCSLFLEIET